MHFIDSHAHLADPAFDDDRGAVIARARAAGAVAVVCIGESIAAADRAARIAAAEPRFAYHTAGVHPHDAAQFDEARDLDAIRRHLEAGAVAVGECGLDYHYDHSPRDAQRRAFEAQLDLAAELRAPVVVHSREAETDTEAMIAAASGNGVRGVVTFKKWADVELLRLVPDDRVLVESDAPYLAPVPNRGRRNEPALVPHTIERLAAARDTSREAIADLTSANARRLFGLAMPDALR
jgi:TatD DNase family protein